MEPGGRGPAVRRAESDVPGPVAAAAPPPNSAIGADRTPDVPVGAPGRPATAAPAKNDNLPSSGRVREEYANSGRWIREPGKSD